MSATDKRLERVKQVLQWVSRKMPFTLLCLRVEDWVARRSPNLHEEFSSWRLAAFQTDDHSTGMSDAVPATPDFEPQFPPSHENFDVDGGGPRLRLWKDHDNYVRVRVFCLQRLLG
jgi:hypothetical protein